MRKTTYYSNRPAGPLTRAVRFPFTLSVRVDDSQAASFSYTLETWFRLEAWANATGPFGGAGSESVQMLFLASGPAGYSFLLRLNNNGEGLGALEFFNYAGGAITSAPLVPAGKWVHVRCTYDMGTLEGKIYLNNAVVAQGYFTAAQPSISALNLGHIDSYRTMSNVNGQMDETRLWPFVRSAAQNAASWQLPNHELPDLNSATAAWNYEDPIPGSGAAWPGFADGSGHGLFLRSSTNSYEGSQPYSKVPFGQKALMAPGAPAWDYDASKISADASEWINSGSAPSQVLELSGIATIDSTAGPNTTPCVAFSNQSCYNGTVNVGIVGNDPRTHLVIFKTEGNNNIELMGWGGTSAYGQLYDTMIYSGALIQHFYGFEIYSVNPASTGKWSIWLVRATPLNENSLAMNLWLNGVYTENTVQIATADSPLRIGAGHYEKPTD